LKMIFYKKSMPEKINGKLVLIITSVCAFMTPFMVSSVNIALPTIGREFMANAVYLNWIVTAYLLTTAALLLPIGRIADIKGRVKILRIGLFVIAAGAALCAVSVNIHMLIVARVIQGIGASMDFSTSTAILVSSFPVEKRGKVLGFNVAVVYTGLSSGPFIGGLITEYFGWRGIFLFTLALSIAAIILVGAWYKTDWVEAKGEKFDLRGSVFYGASLVAIIYGFSLLPDFTGFALTAAGVIAFLLFIRYESKQDDPVLNTSLFLSNKAFAFSNIAALINYAATYAVSFLLSLYLQYIKLLTPKEAGIVLIAQPVMQAVFSPFCGRISDKIEPRIVASTGMFITAVGLCILTFLTEQTSLFFIIISLLFLGFGFALFSSPNTNAIMSSVEKKYFGVAASTQSTMRLMGQMFSMGIAMIIFSVFIGKIQITPKVHAALLTSIRIAFIVFSALCFTGVFASLSRGKIRE